MRNSSLKKLIAVCLLVGGSGILWACSSQKKAPLKAEVKLLHKSVYVFNRGDQPWSGGVVFLNERSQEIQKSFGTVNPKGFAQLPLREFRQGSTPVSESSLQLKFVWVEVEGYAPEKFTLGPES